MAETDDGPVGAWQLDAETRIRLREEHLRAAAEAGRWADVELEAEELLDEEPHHPEALFLLGEASLALGRFPVARAAYEGVLATDAPGAAVDPASVLLGLALACFHSCAVPSAIEAAREAVRLDPERAEAHHTLGLALEFVPGRQSEALAALTAAAHLDPDRFPLPVVPKDLGWEDLIGRALERVSPRIRQFYAQVPFRIEELPELEELRSHQPPTSPAVPAMVVGTPPEPDPDADDGQAIPGALPEGVRIFSRNLGRVGSLDGMVEELAHALRDEAWHWWGHPPDDED